MGDSSGSIIDVVAAVVVSYFPDVECLQKLLFTLSEEADVVILVDNGGGQEVCEFIRLHGLDVIYSKLSSNMGLGYALNFGFSRAVEKGAKYISTFDQDSAPVPGMFKKMLHLHKALEARNIQCGAIGPIFYDRRELVRYHFPFYIEENGNIVSKSGFGIQSEFLEVDTLITSGAMIKANAWLDGVRYDENLFVDYTDTDFCFRLRAAGYKVFACLTVEMGHALSDAPPVRIFGLKFFRYSPIRRYYFFRNTILFCKKHYVSNAWRRRLLTALLIRLFINFLIDSKKLNSFRMMTLGSYDGIRGLSGDFDALHG